MCTAGSLEMASEPAASGMVHKVRHKAYPCASGADSSGPTWARRHACRPSVPPPGRPRPSPRQIAKVVLPCNWAQILEGAIDSAHSSSLHSSDMVPARVDGAEATDRNWLRPSTDKAPRMQVQRAPYGFRYAAIRRPIFNAQTHDYVRTTVFVAPWPRR
jgi:phthalate 4,5-dioxygenase oxygenase subunit